MKNTKPTGRTLDMTKGSPMKLLFTFALPLFLGNLLQQFYNLADTSIAGHLLGDAALAQIGATSALYSLITNFAFGLNNGLALNVSRSFGAGDKKEMKRSVCWMVTLAFISALVMTVGFLMFRKPLLTVMQTPEDVLDGALSYFTVILAGIPLTMAYNLESALLQSMGNSVTPLGFLLFSSILNVILDFFFIGNPLNLACRERSGDGALPGTQRGTWLFIHSEKLPGNPFWQERLEGSGKICHRNVLDGTQHGPYERDL